jgi:hypothetical protein
MSEFNQIQAQTQIQPQLNKLKTIEVSKRVYNVVRSVVDSSTKPVYHWNKPIVIANNVVKFVKYKTLPNGLEVKTWAIVIMAKGIQKGGAELEATSIRVNDGFGNKIAELVIRETFLPSEQDLDGFKPYILHVESNRVIAKSIHEYEYYVIKPRDDVPYAEPISLAAFVNKLMFYFAKAVQMLQGLGGQI